MREFTVDAEGLEGFFQSLLPHLEYCAGANTGLCMEGHYVPYSRFRSDLAGQLVSEDFAPQPTPVLGACEYQPFVAVKGYPLVPLGETVKCTMSDPGFGELTYDVRITAIDVVPPTGADVQLVSYAYHLVSIG